jgi:hypothetical protein
MELPKALIMLVRVLGLTAIVLGSLLWMGGHNPLLGPHIGVGFCVAAVVFVMSVIAMIKKAVGVGIAGVLLSMLLPIVGLMQTESPLIPHAMGAIQVAHIAIALTTVGLAERLYSAIQRAG